MRKNINLKSNKGISLITVIVTVILMTIILTSIVYSNNRTNEIKQSMLLNSDIEELTKKTEMYYLEKETLPIKIDENSKFCYKEENKVVDVGEDVYYYRIDTALLENLNLNNKEKIADTKLESVRPGDQWYVINPETHNIYFIKFDIGIEQTAKYSKYNLIISMADEKIDFNKKPNTSRSKWHG